MSSDFECRVHEIIRPSNNQINIVANVLDISADAALYDLPRLEQVQVANAPIYFGMDEEQQHIYGNVCELVREEVTEAAEPQKDIIIDKTSSTKACNYKENAL